MLPQWYTTSVQVPGIFPFGAGSGRPTSGTPQGPDLLNNAWVGTDPQSLFHDGVISSPSCAILGINGVGKSTTFQDLLLGLVARGVVPGIHDPIKGEHAELIKGLGGVAVELGPNRDRINLLDLGPLGDAASKIGGRTGAELTALAVTRAVDRAKMMLRVSRSEPVTDIEDTVIDVLVRHLHSTTPGAVSADLLRCFNAAPAEVIGKLGYDDAVAFRHRFERLGESLRALMMSELGRMLGGTESVRFDAGNPGGWCFDLHHIGETQEKLLSGAMLAGWSLGTDAIDAHWELSKHEAAIAAEASSVGEFYEPKVVWRGYAVGTDEAWYPYRHVPGIVDLADRSGRTNRSSDVTEFKLFHSPKDLRSIPSEAEREAAWGLLERCGLWGLMAMTREDLRELRSTRKLTDAEIELVAGFNAASSWSGPRRKRRHHNGRPAAPPGAGKVLWKVEERVGIPVQLVQTSVQAGIHITDGRVRERERQTDIRHH